MRRKLLGGGALALTALFVAAFITFRGGRLESAGEVNSSRVPAEAVEARLATQRAMPPAPNERAASKAKQVLFGDLHVHTTFSADAFMRSLPLMGGEGAHPPDDACDFARFCSQLEFFSINDHAEALTPRHWKETKASVRQCNAVAGDPESPDVVAFTGFEWSQVGGTPEEHWGHKNVIFRDTAEDLLPARPIAASGLGAALGNRSDTGPSRWTLLSVPVLDFSNRERYLDLVKTMREVTSVPSCPPGVDTRELPVDCREYAATPSELFDKLGQRRSGWSPKPRRRKPSPQGRSSRRSIESSSRTFAPSRRRRWSCGSSRPAAIATMMSRAREPTRHASTSRGAPRWTKSHPWRTCRALRLRAGWSVCASSSNTSGRQWPRRWCV